MALLPLLLVPALASVSAPNPAPESFLPQFWAFGFLARSSPSATWCLATTTSRATAADRSVVARGQPALYGVFWYLLSRQSPRRRALRVLADRLGRGLHQRVDDRRLPDRRKVIAEPQQRLLRYLSDASYWTYIVHLPIVFAIQYHLLDVELPWGIKFAVSVIATFGLCLLSYQAMVRTTFVGDLLGVRSPAAAVQMVK